MCVDETEGAEQTAHEPLYQVYTFEQTMDDFAEQGVAALPLVLSACKLLDLMLVLQTEEFQM